MIVDSAEPRLRSHTAGIHYLTRGLGIARAAAVGGLLWKLAPETPFVAGGIVGVAGTPVFAATAEERYAG